MKTTALALASALVLSASLAPALALAETTGPGATLYKLDDRWVSIDPNATNVVAEAAPAASAAPVVEATPAASIVEAAPVATIPGYSPEANYSGACHVTVDVAGKTYVINETSSMAMVLETPEGKVCLPSEDLARDYGFKKISR